MSLQVLTGFFMWCTIINATLFLFFALACRLLPERVYRLQRRWVPLSREAFSLAFYSFLGAYKLLILVFNLVPWIALLLVA